MPSVAVASITIATNYTSSKDNWYSRDMVKKNNNKKQLLLLLF